MNTYKLFRRRIYFVLLLLIAGRNILSAQQLLWEHWYPELNPGDSLPFDIHTTGLRDPFYGGYSVMENNQNKYFVSARLGLAGGGFMGLDGNGLKMWEKRAPWVTWTDYACNPQYAYPEDNSAVTFVSVRPLRILSEFSYMYSLTIANDGTVLREILDTNIIAGYNGPQKLDQ